MLSSNKPMLKHHTEAIQSYPRHYREIDVVTEGDFNHI